jgi:hypothetical protein
MTIVPCITDKPIRQDEPVAKYLVTYTTQCSPIEPMSFSITLCH